MKKQSVNIHWQRVFFAVLFFSATLITGFFYCGRTKEVQTSIRPPVPEADVPFELFSMHPDSQLVIQRATGTRLSIPARSLVRKDGQPLEGDIIVKVREFHSASDILRAGIPMNVTEGYLESGGMLEVRAYNKDAELQLGSGQSIDVSLAAFKPSNGYRLYSLQENRNWMVNDTFNTVTNDAKKVRLRALDSLESLGKSGQMEDTMIFELVMDTIESPHLIPFFGQQWVITDPNQNAAVKAALRVHWDDVEVIPVNPKKMIYELKFSLTRFKEYEEGTERFFRIQASPVVDGKKKRERRLKFKEQMDMYAAAYEKVKEERARMAQQADLLNSFKMNELGICNIDRVLNMGEYVIRKVTFDFEKTIDPKFIKPDLYVLFEDNNSYISYARKDWDKIIIPKTKRVSMLAVLSNNEIAVIDTIQLRSMINEKSDILFLTTRRVAAAAYLKSLGSVPSLP